MAASASICCFRRRRVSSTKYTVSAALTNSAAISRRFCSLAESMASRTTAWSRFTKAASIARVCWSPCRMAARSGMSDSSRAPALMPWASPATSAGVPPSCVAGARRDSRASSPAEACSASADWRPSVPESTASATPLTKVR